MRGLPNHGFPAFDAAARYLREQGHEVISPADHDREVGFDGTAEDYAGFDLAAAILWDLHAIAESDCVWVLPGWEFSLGCAVEIALARFLGLPVIELKDV